MILNVGSSDVGIFSGIISIHAFAWGVLLNQVQHIIVGSATRQYTYM
jgi:hypothetical protein